MKKVMVLLFCMLMMHGLIYSNAVAEEVKKEQTPVLTMLLSGGNNPPQENEVLTELGKRLGVKINVIYVADADYTAKLNTLIASKSIPDIFGVNSNSTLMDLYKGGYLYNFSGLLPTYGQNILKYYGDDLYKHVLNNNKGVYVLVSDAGNYLKNLAIRLDWLKNVGMDVPTDLDSFYDVLYAFTYKDPDGNGKNDTYGFAGTMVDDASWQHIFAAFGIPCRFTNGLIRIDDGTVTTFMKHPNFLKAIQYIRKLYKDGILDPDFATLTRMQCNERLWQGRVGVYAFQATGTTNNWYPGRYTFKVPSDPAELFGFIHLNNTGAVKIYPNYTIADAVISSKCEHPELAVKLLNYIYFTEEGQELTYLGIEGVHFQWTDKANGKYKRLGVYTDDTLHRAAGAFVYNPKGGFTKINAETRIMNDLTQQTLAVENELATPYVALNTALASRI
ncbi:MAG: extracellular solute-binding protein, partial [Clostridiales bacterium]|nr:extracellular solute-binding protein [Clostridiales bacterium]